MADVKMSKQRGRRGGRRRNKGRRGARRGQSMPFVSQAVKAYVKRAVKIQSELKHAQPISENNRPIEPFGQLSNGPHQATTFPLNGIFANVFQGVDDGQRIGDKIRVKSLNIKGYVNLDSTKANVEAYKKNPMYVKMFIGRRIDSTSNPNNAGTTGLSDLFQYGSTTSPPLNLPSDMYRYVNKEVYKIYTTRTFKIGSSAPSNVPNDSAQWNNDFSWSKYFSISLNKHVDVVKYITTPGVGNTPSNVSFYMWFVLCFANGSAVNSVDNLPPLECHYDVQMTYYDS